MIEMESFLSDPTDPATKLWKEIMDERKPIWRNDSVICGPGRREFKHSDGRCVLTDQGRWLRKGMGMDPTAECPMAHDDQSVVEEALEAARTARSLRGDVVEMPSHYTQLPVECIDVTEHFSFTLGNAIKYIWRADHKGRPLEDLKKARWYIDREIARRERE